MPRIAINGVGRIGRHVLRLAMQSKDVDIVAVNDLVPASNLAYLIKYDTTHGKYTGTVESTDDALIIDGKQIQVFSMRNPEELPWKELKIDYVVESTGHFTTYEHAYKHIQAGAKRVLISAPGKGDIPTLVMGVNHTQYDPKKDQIVSNASCTTNCLAPMTKVLLDAFGIEEGLMTTVHAITPTQPTLDSPSKKDLRGGRAAGYNIIPASTGAAKAVSQCIPEIKGKLTGMAFRVPTIDVSVVDLTVKLSKKTSYEEICDVMKQASQTHLKGILGYTEEPLVSSDFLGNTHSAIFDRHAGIALNSQFYKLIAWYDNEVGYCQRILDMLKFFESKES
ncbi:MAG: Glyceraldehyde-3-phosphate dehydrogenase 1 [Chlamydiae bacterium]|nr:Glyceraldehyde-3-phosphate dehydrogenase 1 [Chlamydiota bacterium]